MRKFAALRTSLIAQLSILFVFALSLFLFTVFAIPALSLLDQPNKEVSATMSRIQLEVIGGLQNGNSREDILDKEVLSATLKRNPDLNVYGRYRDNEFLIGEKPEEVQIPLPQGFIVTAMNDDEPCDGSSALYLHGRKDGGHSITVASRCPGAGQYFALSGLKNPPHVDQNILSAYWAFFKRDLMERLGLSLLLFLVAAFVIGRSINAVRKVVELAAHQFIETREGELPEEGIPIEVRPMVHKLNELLARVRGEAERQRFFLAASAHELRTPLTILRTRMAELPENDARSAMEGDVRRMARLLEQLLRLTRLTDEVEIGKARIDLNDIGRKACAHRAIFAHESGVEIEFVASPVASEITGNASMVASAVTNVIDNAISVTPVGGKVVVIVSNNGQVTIEDEGPGLSPEIAGKLFQPFSKFPPNRKGSGLGLAIVDAVMRLHGGVARLAPSQYGAKFVLDFTPLKKPKQSDPPGA